MFQTDDSYGSVTHQLRHKKSIDRILDINICLMHYNVLQHAAKKSQSVPMQTAVKKQNLIRVEIKWNQDQVIQLLQLDFHIHQNSKYLSQQDQEHV